MQRFSKIRWTKNDYKRLRSSINKFNRKVVKLKSKGLSYIPEEVSYMKYKKLIKSRRDLEREIRTLDRFSRKNAEELVFVPSAEGNVPITRWQRTEINRRKGIINRRRKETFDTLSNLEFTYQGKGMGYKLKDFGMGSELRNAYKPFVSFSENVSNLDIKRKWNVVVNQSQSDYISYRNDILRNNILGTIKENYKINDVKDVLESIKNMSDDDLLVRFNRTGGNFEPFYPDDEHYQYFLNDLKANWL